MLLAPKAMLCFGQLPQLCATADSPGGFGEYVYFFGGTNLRQLRPTGIERRLRAASLATLVAFFGPL